ncbi:hypothetical protein LTS18_003077 [Coniosporium uncinatum]|uniref:Uncharacterized protein n=1 Tax=Coniosporium uncinatum TaxID=93489 RepID=A0ACC3D7F7_9PEZI|nr:hypothetical protein LTS18_003077 [Coniosporium uncinatum]
MNTYWKDYQGNDEIFWEHEWGKHGTCISTLDPSCYTDYTPGAEAADFFDKAVELFKQLPSYDWLAAAGISPSTTKTYTSSAITAALKAQFGYDVIVQCRSGALDEIWYSYNVRGSIQTGQFVASNPDGTKGNCPASGIKYLPKTSDGGSGSSSTTMATVTKTTTTAQPTGTGGAFAGKGYLSAVTSGSQKGCIISAGTWYTSGTCATFTAASSGDGFTLSSSKGKCAISGGVLTCASSVSAATVFTSVNGKLAADGASEFYADAVPAGSTQQKVYTGSHAVEVEFVWQNL